jgi:hypothetical protein
VDDDARPLGGTPALMKKQIARESSAMLCAGARPGRERAGEHRETENEAPPDTGLARSSINRHDWTPFANRRSGSLREEQLQRQWIGFSRIL